MNKNKMHLLSGADVILSDVHNLSIDGEVTRDHDYISAGFCSSR